MHNQRKLPNPVNRLKQLNRLNRLACPMWLARSIQHNCHVRSKCLYVNNRLIRHSILI